MDIIASNLKSLERQQSVAVAQIRTIKGVQDCAELSRYDHSFTVTVALINNRRTCGRRRGAHSVGDDKYLYEAGNR